MKSQKILSGPFYNCHDFYQSRSLSLFWRCSAVDVTGLLALIDPFFIFYWFCLVFLHTWFRSHSLLCCVFNPLFPLMSLSELVVTLVFYGLVRDGFLFPHVFYYVLWLCSFCFKLLNHYTKFDSPAPDFPATYTHDMTILFWKWCLNCLFEDTF